MRVGVAGRAVVTAAAAGLALLLAQSAGAHQLIGSRGAQTDPASSVTSTTATLNGELGALSGSDSGNCGSWHFDYGTMISYGSSTMPQPAGEGEVSVSAMITGLTPNTTYHFRIATTDGLFNVGSDMTFTTMPATSCGASTGAASDLTPTSATLHGTLGSTGASDASACGMWHFDYGTSSGYGSSTAPTAAGSGSSVPVSATVNGLTPGTTYHFRLAASSGTENTGSDVTFTTPFMSCGARTDSPPTDVTQTSMTLHGTLGSTSGSDASACGSWHFDYGTTTTYGSSTPSTAAGSGMSVPVSATITGLTPGTTYHFRLAATSGTESVGSDAAFTTASPPPPEPPPPDTTITQPPSTPTPTPARAPAPTPASPKPQPPPPAVVINESIGSIALGMAEAEVIAQLGEPSSTLELTLGGGKKGRFVRYRSHGGWLLITYDSSGRVASIEATSPFYVTAGGIGPGSQLTQAEALPGFRTDFCEAGVWNGSAQTKPNDVVTVFAAAGGEIASVLITELRLYTACFSGSTELPPPPQPKTIVLGRSIGGVSIGMLRSDVTELLGAPRSTLLLSLDAGENGVFARYRSHGKPLLVTFDSAGRVVSVEAYAPFFRTLGGVGPGAPLTLVQRLPGFRPDYCELGFWNGTARTRPRNIVTVFTPNGGFVESVLIAQLRLYTACAGGSPELPPSA
jgi:hypothetical protein